MKSTARSADAPTPAAMDSMTATSTSLVTTSSPNKSTPVAGTSGVGRKNVLALKRIAYNREEEQEHFRDEENFVGSMGPLKRLFAKQSKAKRNCHDSSFEVLDGSFSDLRPIAETSKRLVHSTPNHGIEIVSGNSSICTFAAPTPRNESASSLEETKRFYNNLRQSLRMRRIQEKEWELQKTKSYFDKFRNEVSNVLERLEDEYIQSIRHNEETIKMQDDWIKELQADNRERKNSLKRQREEVEVYRKFSRNILERLPRKFFFTQR